MTDPGHQLITADAMRVLVAGRQGERCARCWEPMGDRFEMHHRLKRALAPGWCACWTVGLHPRCHTMGNGEAWAVHDRPQASRLLGLIVPTWDDPRTVLLTIEWPWRGPAFLSCDGLAVSELTGAPPTT